MKKILGFMVGCLPLVTLHAHDHVEVGKNTTNPSQLGFYGPGIQLALYVPVGEFFSGYAPHFPGGCFADELTFTTEVNILQDATGSDPEVELVAVTGPAGGSLFFWETDARLPTWARPTGWMQTSTDRPSFAVIVGGDGHVHGRAFSVDRPGEYQAVFRLRDQNNRYAMSQNYTVLFRALTPPPLSIRVENGQAIVGFNSRLNLVYDLEICTDLAGGAWSPAEPHTFMDGTGQLMECVIPIEHLRAFFRLIEYK